MGNKVVQYNISLCWSDLFGDLLFIVRAKWVAVGAKLTLTTCLSSSYTEWGALHMHEGVHMQVLKFV